ncbi:hypothetical protein ES332_A01G098000v1 [Gossypium tomentosum]|uniref:Uncharacterized protein n=1 Tax=Gossypium tomentosum TaxID=34277 RepID=A0A5D2RRA6_GOSTO|nr:hypothetical protein ES332_A01G098000v1 [Gossypium tomentosum]
MDLGLGCFRINAQSLCSKAKPVIKGSYNPEQHELKTCRTVDSAGNDHCISVF